MRGSALRWAIFMTAIFLSAQFAMAAKASLNQQVLVVYDPTVPDSVNVANHYLAARSIP